VISPFSATSGTVDTTTTIMSIDMDPVKNPLVALSQQQQQVAENALRAVASSPSKSVAMAQVAIANNAVDIIDYMLKSLDTSINSIQNKLQTVNPADKEMLAEGQKVLQLMIVIKQYTQAAKTGAQTAASKAQTLALSKK